MASTGSVSLLLHSRLFVVVVSKGGSLQCLPLPKDPLLLSLLEGGSLLCLQLPKDPLLLSLLEGGFLRGLRLLPLLKGDSV